MKCRVHRRVVSLLLPAACVSCLALAQSQQSPLPDSTASLSIATDVPLRIEVTRTITLKTGKPFRARLTEPIYGPDRLLLPAGVTAEGIVSATPAADRSTRVNATLDGGIARQGVTSNGFGLFARVITMVTASRNASTGFAVFALGKSVYRRYIARGHQVSFPANTELAIDLNLR